MKDGPGLSQGVPAWRAPLLSESLAPEERDQAIS